MITNLPAAIDAYLNEHKSVYDVLELAFVFNRDAEEIERALRQLEREGKAQTDGELWRMKLEKQVQQRELFA